MKPIHRAAGILSFLVACTAPIAALVSVARGEGANAARIAGLEITIMFMGSTLVSPLYVLYQREFGFSEVTLTLVYAIYVLGNLGALFFFGWLSDQIGRHRTNLPAIGLGAVATLVFLFASSTPWLFVGRALSGLAIGVAAAAANVDWPRYRADQSSASRCAPSID